MENILAAAIAAFALIAQVGSFVLYDGKVQEAARSNDT